jgi:hypothetical protein
VNEIDAEMEKRRQQTIKNLIEHGQMKLAMKHATDGIEMIMAAAKREEERTALISRVRRYIPETFKPYLNCLENFKTGPNEMLFNTFVLEIPECGNVYLFFKNDPRKSYQAYFRTIDPETGKIDEQSTTTDIELALARAKQAAEIIEERKLAALEPRYVDIEVSGDICNISADTLANLLQRIVTVQF